MPTLAITAALLLTAPPRLAVLDVKPRVGVSSALAQGITDALVHEVRRRNPNLGVIASDEIREMIGLERQRQQLGCGNLSCLAEIGGALGAERMVTGSLGRFGKSYLLSLQLVDVRRATVEREGSVRISDQGEEALLDAVQRLTAELFPLPAAKAAPPVAITAPPPPGLSIEAPPPSVSPTVSHPRPLAWALAGVTVAAGAVAIVGAVQVANFNSANNALTATPPSIAWSSYGAGQNAAVNAGRWGTASLVLAGVAAAGIVGTIFAW